MGDGGITVAGGTTSFGAGNADLWIIRLDANGNIIWGNAYGGANDDAPGGAYEEYVARVVNSGDGYLVAGTVTESFGSGGDIWVLKVNANSGSILWEYSYGGEDEDSTWSLSTMSDGGFLITGSYAYTNPQWDADAWAIRLNSDGTIQWQKTYGLSGKYDEVLSETPTSDGGAIFSSYYEETNNDWQASLIKVDSNGNFEWAQAYNPGEFDWTNDVAETQDGYLAIGVASGSTLMIWKVDKNGSSQNCENTNSLAISVKDTSVSPMPTNATVTPTSATVRDVNVNTQEVTLNYINQCGL